MNKLLIILMLFIFANITAQLPSWVTNVVIIEDDSPSELAKYPSTPANNTAYLFRAGQTFTTDRTFSVSATNFYVGSTDYNGDSLAYINSTLESNSGKIFSGTAYRNAYYVNLWLNVSMYTDSLADNHGVMAIDARLYRVEGETDSDEYIINFHVRGGYGGVRGAGFGTDAGEEPDIHIYNSTFRRHWGDGLYLDHNDSVFLNNVKVDSVCLHNNINPLWIGGDAFQQEYADYISIKNSYLSHAEVNGKFAFIANYVREVNVENTHLKGQDFSGSGTTVYVGYLPELDVWTFRNCIIEGGATGLSKHSNNIHAYNSVFIGYSSAALAFQTGSYGFSPSYIDSCTFIDITGTAVIGNTSPDSIYISNSLFDDVNTISTGTGVALINNTTNNSPTYLNEVYNTSLAYGAHIDIDNFSYDPTVTGLPDEPDPNPNPNPTGDRIYFKVRRNGYYFYRSNN